MYPSSATQMHIFPPPPSSSSPQQTTTRKMTSPLSTEARRRASAADPRWVSRALLRVLATVAALIAMALFAASVAATNKEFVNLDGPGDWTDGLALAPSVYVLLYNPISLMLHLKTRNGRPLHPAIHVVLDFLAWALAVPALIVSMAGGIFWNWTTATPTTNGTIDCGFSFNFFTMECYPDVFRIGRMEIAGAVFLFFIFLAHSALFVMACVDLYRRRVAWDRALADGNFDMQAPKDSERGSLSHESQ